MEKKELITMARDFSGSSEFFSQKEYLIGEEFRMSKLIDMLREEYKKKIDTLRDELYDQLPTGKIDGFELIKLIKNHIRKLDELMEE